jgi:DNA-directed RNA polymerase subunit K/omega
MSDIPKPISASAPVDAPALEADNDMDIVKKDENKNEDEDYELQELSDVEIENNMTNGKLKLKPSSARYDDEDDDDEDDDDDKEEDDDDEDNEEDNEDINDMNDPEDDEEDVENEKIISKSVDANEDLNDDENDNDNDNENDNDDENYLKKFDKDVKNKFLESYHPEVFAHNYEEVKMLSNVVRDENNIINDPLHKTIPFLTKFEKSRILGQRAKQLDSGAHSFVSIDKGVIDGYVIALKELEQKVIPFIIKRPLPNGGFEYWKVSDLELIC